MAVLVDTSVWIDHLRRADSMLVGSLTRGAVLVHPCVLGELSCGTLHDRRNVLRFLRDLPCARVATDEEAHYLLEQRKLWGRGLGWIDIHLLTSALLTGCALWTHDQRLADVAGELFNKP